MRLDDVEVRFDTRKAVALLAVLAVAARELGRDALTGMLWPELDRARARAALRRTLSVASAVGPALRSAGDAIALDPEAVSCDVREFQRLAASPQLADRLEADRLYTDGFLAGFALRDSAVFEDWQLATSDALRIQAAENLVGLTLDATGARDFEAAVRHARRRIALDPLSEAAHADLIRVLAWSGDRAAALGEYRRLTRLLERELGVSPLPESVALRNAVRAGTLEPPPPPAAAAAVRRNTSRADLATSPELADLEAKWRDSIGQALVRLGKYDEALEALAQAAALVGDDDERRGAIERDIAGVHARLGDWTRARGHLEQARRLISSAPQRGRVLADLALVLHRLGQDGEAERAAVAAERDAGADPAARSQAHSALGALAAARGHLEAAVEHFDLAAELAGEASDGDLLIAARNGRARALFGLGRLEAALAAAREAVELAQRQGDRHRLAALHSNLADLLHALGLESEAMVELKRSAMAFADVQDAASRPAVWTLAEW